MLCICACLEERAAGAAAAWVRVHGGDAAKHRAGTVLLVRVAQVVVVVVVVDALPVLALAAAAATEAAQLLVAQQTQGLGRLVRQVALLGSPLSICHAMEA